MSTLGKYLIPLYNLQSSFYQEEENQFHQIAYDFENSIHLSEGCTIAILDYMSKTMGLSIDSNISKFQVHNILSYINVRLAIRKHMNNFRHIRFEKLSNYLTYWNCKSLSDTKGIYKREIPYDLCSMSYEICESVYDETLTDMFKILINKASVLGTNWNESTVRIFVEEILFYCCLRTKDSLDTDIKLVSEDNFSITITEEMTISGRIDYVVYRGTVPIGAIECKDRLKLGTCGYKESESQLFLELVSIQEYRRKLVNVLDNIILWGILCSDRTWTLYILDYEMNYIKICTQEITFETNEKDILQIGKISYMITKCMYGDIVKLIETIRTKKLSLEVERLFEEIQQDRCIDREVYKPEKIVVFREFTNMVNDLKHITLMFQNFIDTIKCLAKR